ncbi:hypothetical protein FZEAL_6983 [Fusarium zealandicum]|uniref:GPI anchored cell wall protein n=1 Tax=Fusarium zealandicum TaxID=1053134 RepID=A0A8H4UHF9_9HYPO|nr:hypothetical protein FZEAL_6983 [Fusarium zealandicum]
MARSLALLAGVFAFAAAKTTIDIIHPFLDDQPLEGSIVKVNGDATTLVFDCPASAEPSDCGFTEAQTIVAGTSTMRLTYTVPGDEEFSPMTQEIQCKLDPKKSMADCQVIVTSGESGEFVTTASPPVGASDRVNYSEWVHTVTVTAGADKLKGDGDDTASAIGSAATAASKPTATEATATDSDSASASASDAESTPVSTDNAAGPMMTHNAVLAGVLAAVGGAAMLL